MMMWLSLPAPYVLRRSSTESMADARMRIAASCGAALAAGTLLEHMNNKSQAFAWLSIVQRLHRAPCGALACLVGAGVFHCLGDFRTVKQFDEGHRRIVANAEAHLQDA